jgi:hypothetical protein
MALKQLFTSARMFCTLTVLLLVAFSHHVRAAPAFDPSKVATSPRAFLNDNAVILDGSSDHAYDDTLPRGDPVSALEQRGGGLIPAGYNPFGYKTTALGERFLEFGPTCLESDVGRLLASLKTKRKTLSLIQTQWLEIVRVSKSGQSMRIYRSLQDLIDFCLAARLID